MLKVILRSGEMRLPLLLLLLLQVAQSIGSGFNDHRTAC